MSDLVQATCYRCNKSIMMVPPEITWEDEGKLWYDCRCKPDPDLRFPEWDLARSKISIREAVATSGRNQIDHLLTSVYHLHLAIEKLVQLIPVRLFEDNKKLSEYKGSANSEEIFQYLVGEKISAVFRDGSKLIIVLSSGIAFVVTSLGGDTPPAFWREDQEQTQSRLLRRRAELERGMAELGWRDDSGNS